MPRCRYKRSVQFGEGECPLEAQSGEEYCYWHKKQKGKKPTKEKLEELKEKKLYNIYLEKSELQEDLPGANLQGAILKEAKLKGIQLEDAKLQGADLWKAKLQCTNLKGAKLQEASMIETELQGANLERTKLQGANLRQAKLQCTNLYAAVFDSKTSLDGTVLTGANLFQSYFDEAKSFRNAKMVQERMDKEINEIAGDSFDGFVIKVLGFVERIKKCSVTALILKLISKLQLGPFLTSVLKLKRKLPIQLPMRLCLLDMDKVNKISLLAGGELQSKGLVRYIGEGKRIVFFDRLSRCVINNPESMHRHRGDPVVVDLPDLIKDGEIQEGVLYWDRVYLYEASYDVYNNLYNFYRANGRVDKATQVHYRREEVHRKLLREKGGLNWVSSWIFDFFILRLLTGYGDKLKRPPIASVIIIVLFAVFFKLTNGITKKMNGEPVTPDWMDYLYHSITTFLSLGSANIELNLEVGHFPQVLVTVEAGLGVLMLALIIFVVTYHVSR